MQDDRQPRQERRDARPAGEVRAGDEVGGYQILGELGRGGMGAVYRALDPRLDREVALKILPGEVTGDRSRLERFRHEARVLARLDHPNLVTIFSIEEHEGTHFLTMELVDGAPLSALIPKGGMPLARFLDLALGLSRGVAAAHRAGIVHRDLKPANAMVEADGRLRVVDFGLAKHGRTVGASDAATATDLDTRPGALLGTVAYMSPEQAQGREVDARSDVFSLGCVFYEMLAGERPFAGDSSAEILLRLVGEEPPPLSSVRPDLPRQVCTLVERCLEKRPDRRFSSAGELAEQVAASRVELLEPPSIRSTLRRPIVWVPAALLVIVLVVLALGIAGEAQRRRWAREEALPEAERLLAEQRTIPAFDLLIRAEERIPFDPLLERLMGQATLEVSIRTEPPGADIFWRGYREPDQAFRLLGRTPIDEARLPDDQIALMATKKGSATIELARPAALLGGGLHLELVPVDEARPGMVRVDGQPFAFSAAEPVAVDDYWIDRFEVTNEEYERFVDAGGYRERRYWTEPFLEGERELSFEEAMGRFVDATGRPGPATWSLGAHPEGEERHPVRGVSWYEAAAYAEFAGKSLPTVHHWRLAAGADVFGEQQRIARFEAETPLPVGESRSLGPWGTYDQAGNVAEWVSNRTGELRYSLGGWWGAPSHLFLDNRAASPFDRSPFNGFRCAVYDRAAHEEARAPIELERHDFRDREPMAEESFEELLSLFAYEPLPLDPKVEDVREGPGGSRREVVSFAAAYGDDRVPAHLFLPAGAEPPFQAVVYYPGSTAQFFRSSASLADLAIMEFLPRTGRAMLYPVYEGTYERRYEGPARSESERLQRFVHKVLDLRRAVDYLLDRDDVDPERIAYVGLSAGAEYGSVMLAVEPRFRAAVLLAGGFDDTHMLREPEWQNPWHYAPRVQMPTLMINGADDFILPVETGQVPLFELLGPPREQKRHVVIEGGHVPSDRAAMIRETLDWLDRWLGLVERRPAE
ncbi:MAG TPA: protein kinase [Thermoanaerobaculia bacterium]|nr:protein kinase [Thermoanaerobaculia bacterium]